MSPEKASGILDVPLEERTFLEPILVESFDGWYQRHSIKTLHQVERVRAMEVDGVPAGLCMLKVLEKEIGYVYYIAVARDYRKRGIGGALLDDALHCFRGLEVMEVYASMENEDAARLFGSKGFTRTDFGRVSDRYGFLHALSLYKSMLAVPGEVLMHLDLGGPKATDASHV